MITLATLHQHTEKQIFDHIANHLLTQGVKCAEIDDVGEGPTCKYRNDVNQSCAAGCLISTEEYKPAMEGNNWESLADKRIVPTSHFVLITILQKVHDTVPADEWYKNLLFVAQSYKFDTSNLDRYAKENNFIQ